MGKPVRSFTDDGSMVNEARFIGRSRFGAIERAEGSRFVTGGVHISGNRWKLTRQVRAKNLAFGAKTPKIGVDDVSKSPC